MSSGLRSYRAETCLCSPETSLSPVFRGGSLSRFRYSRPCQPTAFRCLPLYLVGSLQFRVLSSGLSRCQNFARGFDRILVCSLLGMLMIHVKSVLQCSCIMLDDITRSGSYPRGSFELWKPCLVGDGRPLTPRDTFVCERKRPFRMIFGVLLGTSP